MSYLLLGNFDFEHELTGANYSPTATLRRMNEELSWHLTALSRPEDAVWVPNAPDQDFLEIWRSEASGGDVVTSLNDLPCRFTARPWGWSPQVVKLALRHAIHCEAPALDVVKQANSRRWSFELEGRLDVRLPGCFVVTDIKSLEQRLRADFESKPHQQWVIKAEYGMSARERVVGCGVVLDDTSRRWIEKRLRQREWLVWEPWLEREAEAGLLWDVPADTTLASEPRLVALTELLTDARGQYSGSRVIATDETEAIARWQPAIAATRLVSQELQRMGYFGPLGVDAMRYRRDDGTIAVRAVQDINTRWTMGFIAAAYASHWAPDQAALWQLISTEKLCRHLQVDPHQLMATLIENRTLNLAGHLDANGIQGRIQLTSPTVTRGQVARSVGILLTGEAMQCEQANFLGASPRLA